MAATAQRRRVLVVDDDLDIRVMISDALLANGYAVLTASDGEEGLRHARAWRPHLVLCDLVMPRMNGYEFVTAYRQLEGVPTGAIVVMTAAGSGVQRITDDLHPDAILGKPFMLHDLLTVVARHARLPAA